MDDMRTISDPELAEEEKKRIKNATTYMRRAKTCEEDAEARREERMKDAETNWRAAGREIRKLKEMSRSMTWERFCSEKLGISRARADELIRVAEQRTTVRKVREQKRDSVRKSRAASEPLLQNTRSSGNHDIPIKELRKIGKQHDLTPKQQEVLEKTGSLLAAKRCDFDYEHDVEPGETAAEAHRGAFEWQSAEGVRLARDSALLRNGAEVIPDDLAAIDAVIDAWKELRGKILPRVVKGAGART